MENTEENCEKIWKIQKKSKLNSVKIGKMRKKFWNDKENMEEKVIRYGQYGRKEGWIVKRYEKYGSKVSWIVKRFGKYRRKLWNDMENMEEKWVE